MKVAGATASARVALALVGCSAQPPGGSTEGAASSSVSVLAALYPYEVDSPQADDLALDR